MTENRISRIQRLVPGKDEIPSRARRKVRPGEIVYSTVRPNQRHFGLMREVPENFLASTGFSVIRGKEGVARTDFVYWFLAQDRVVELLQTIAETSTSAYPSIRPADIEGLTLDLPPLSEQRAIARVLGALDDKIEANRRMSAALEGLAQAAFKDWFVDFGPTRAKAAGRAPWLPAPLWSLFPDRLVDSELGEIPKGWEVGCLGAVAAASRRGADPVSLDDETPYIGLEHMPRRSIALADWDRVGKVTSNKTVFEKGDILFGKLNPHFHKVGIAPTNGVCSTDILVIVPKAAEWAAFVTASVSSVRFVDHADRTSTGTSLPRTSWKTMSGYRLCLPEAAVARAFQDAVQPALERIVVNIHQSRALAGLRDALLPRLVSGELRVRRAE